MKVLITGASGLLGRKLFEVISKTEETTGTYFGNRIEGLYYLDVSDKNSVNNFFEKLKPDIIIHCAVLVNVDYCEEHPDEAKKVNTEGTRNIVEACKRNNCKMVYISSDYVFDGESSLYNEESQTNPINYYGVTKLEGEKIVKENLEDYIIIRPAILYGEDCNKKNFVYKIAEKLRNGEKVAVDGKIIKYPTLIDDIAEAIKKLIEIDARGVYHVAGEEAVTKYEWAEKIARLYNLPTHNLVKENSITKASRPKNVKLDVSKIKKFGVTFSSIEQGLKNIKNQEGCLWRMIYSSRPDKLLLGQSASNFRIEVGKVLAREQPADADIVIPIPESGIYGATGYSEESKIPFYFGLIRDYYTDKTFFEPTLQMRSASLDKKIIVVPDVVKDNRVILIDEAIIAGTTLAIAVEKLRKSGAKEIHVRIPSPPMIFRCENKVLSKDADLIAKRFGDNKEQIEEELAKHFQVESLKFLSLDGFLSCLKNKKDVCVECFKKKSKVKIIRLNYVPDEIRGGGDYSIKRLFTEVLRKNPQNIGFYQTTIPRGGIVKNHAHKDLDEILYFITKGKVKIEEEIIEFNPGDIAILPPMSFHEIIADESEVRLIAVKLPNIIDDKVELN
ncbi:MAG TPA: sugar nucleotide-binding protein [Candidatus Paceibacterota bacterium]|nr:sugar nucleotide-binding protein [Candidatus Paceibacterota bacterium]